MEGRSPDGLTWRDYFQRLRSPDDDQQEEPVRKEGITVLEPGAEFDPQQAPGGIKTLAKRLDSQGWSVKGRRSRVRVPATYLLSDGKSGKAGDVRTEAHELETYVLAAIKTAGGQSMTIDATWERKAKGDKPGSLTFQGATTIDPILGHEWRSTSAKPRKPREWELEEGAAPPMGFNEWLNIVAPK